MQLWQAYRREDVVRWKGGKGVKGVRCLGGGGAADKGRLRDEELEGFLVQAIVTGRLPPCAPQFLGPGKAREGQGREPDRTRLLMTKAGSARPSIPSTSERTPSRILIRSCKTSPSAPGPWPPSGALASSLTAAGTCPVRSARLLMSRSILERTRQTGVCHTRQVGRGSRLGSRDRGQTL